MTNLTLTILISTNINVTVNGDLMTQTSFMEEKHIITYVYDGTVHGVTNIITRPQFQRLFRKRTVWDEIPAQ